MSAAAEARRADPAREIDVRTGVEAVAIDPESRTVRTGDGEEVGYGALLVATGARPVRPPVPGADLPGVRPSSELARAAGCAAGAVWMPLATTASRQGRVAARDMAAPVRGRPFAGVLGSWVSRFGQVGFGATGIDERAAAAAGFAPAAIAREGRDRSGYMPGERRVLVRLVWDERSGRLLGGQVAGSGEVAQRLHALSVAVASRTTIRELAECDLGYAPPVSPLRDPLELAAAAAIGDAP
jgi:NADPH-dependent 2,4-dienoyl-CoA reductase/sulfur reductase-like enzyme